jgi:DNA-binding NarL/FixJ family response regulator
LLGGRVAGLLCLGAGLAQVRDVRRVVDGRDTLLGRLGWLLEGEPAGGFEVCRRLRSEAATKGVSVLMVTALDQATDVETAVDAGTDDFITKPINKAELLLRAKAMLASRNEPTEAGRALAYIGRVQQGL